MSGHVRVIEIGDCVPALQAFRAVTSSTNERSMIASSTPVNPLGHNATGFDLGHSQTVAKTLVLANMNCIPLDWSARMSISGVSMSNFVVKQLPILPPEFYLEVSRCGQEWVKLVVPKVLELTYTSEEMRPFAEDLGYEGPPFVWDEERRHRLRSELDGIYAHMYQLSRSDLEWMLDAPPPYATFPGLKNKELKEYGEFRTKRYVLQVWDQLERGQTPELT